MPVMQRVSPEEARDRVAGLLGDKASEVQLLHGHVDVTCPPDAVRDVMTALRDGDGVRCRFFTFLSAIDRSEVADNPGGLEVLIHVYAPDSTIHVNVHVPVDAEAPSCPSITDIYAGAHWAERETHEMFGIDFPGHPRLVNLYLPEDFDGHPLLRSFKLPSRIVKDWPGAKDPEEAAAGGR
ncbi:MAG TPA: NADH-quinone oxidoreductase subunit C [Actinomycetota bacterium]|nr:NADH-quinone oxidoreductase subunit C [Actinomycetota bacterium]